MTTNNAKNLLQEWCQQNQLDLPVYNTEVMSNFENNPFYTATVYVNQQSFRGPVRWNKKDAQMAVAEIAWAVVQKFNEQQKIIYKGPLTTILIDVENKPKVIEDIYNWINLIQSPHLVIVGIISKNHPLAFRESGVWSQINKTSLLKINSVRSDASDTWMTFLAGKLLAQGVLGQRCLIVSQDHFSQTLVECLQEHGIVSQTATTITEVLKFLE